MTSEIASTSPEVSIGICFRNPGEPFRLALQSVFAQTFTDWELILVNDISTDGAAELAGSLTDPRVRFINDGEGKAFNIRLNEMIRLARGKFFFRMDGDDVMHPDRVRKQVELLRASSPDTVVGSATYSIDQRSAVLGARGVSAQYQDFRARHSFHHPTVAAYTSWFRKHLYSEAYIYQRAEDAELWCRTTAQSTFIAVPDQLLFYREGSSSFPAYLATELVMVHLLRERFRKPVGTYLLNMTRELVKVWVACILDAFDRLDILIARRYRPLDPESRRQAELILDEIRKQELPLLRQVSVAR